MSHVEPSRARRQSGAVAAHRGARRWLALGVVLAGLVSCLACGTGADDASLSSATPDGSPAAPLRVVSINPSLTAILLALDAGDLLVGLDDFSAEQQPQVAHLPRVGGLFNPSLEGVAALEPDVVLLVPSVEQRDFRDRLTQLGIEVAVFENIRLDEVLHNITELGALVGRSDRAAERVRAIRASQEAAQQLASGRPRPRTAIVLQRDPVFLVGTGNFLDELLRIAGANNVGAAFAEAYPQVAVEWLIDAAPEVLIDMTVEPAEPWVFWQRWPAIPAVRDGRVLHLDPKTVTLPGPYLDRSIAVLVAALHGESAAAPLLAAATAASEAP